VELIALAQVRHLVLNAQRVITVITIKRNPAKLVLLAIRRVSLNVLSALVVIIQIRKQPHLVANVQKAIIAAPV